MEQKNTLERRSGAVSINSSVKLTDIKGIVQQKNIDFPPSDF